jgi:hypothetical protein
MAYTTLGRRGIKDWEEGIRRDYLKCPDEVVWCLGKVALGGPN